MYLQVRAQDEGVTDSFDALAADMALALFDELECGVIVCDGQGHTTFANHAARQELASQRLLLCDERVLRKAAGGNEELEAALGQAARRGRRCLLRLTGAGDELMVSVLPFLLHGDITGRVLVFLGRRLPCSDLGLELLAGSYGLTLAERRVLAALVRHATPREIAMAHAVKMSTVRTQIASLRGKFGARNIEGILLRVAQVPPVANALRLGNVAPAAKTYVRAA